MKKVVVSVRDAIGTLNDNGCTPEELYRRKQREKELVKELDLKEVKLDCINSHGQKVYRRGRDYITLDIDCHKGGFWKMFDKKCKRIGTYDEYLHVKIGA